MKEKKYALYGIGVVLISLIGISLAYFVTQIVGNEKNISVPTLAHMNTTLSLVLVILAIAGIAYLLWKRKKQFDS